MELNKEDLNKLIDDRIRKIVPLDFTERRLTDTPLDSFQVVSRGYVTLNGATARRPTASVIGQFYFDTSLGKPVWWSGTAFVDATGSVV